MKPAVRIPKIEIVILVLTASFSIVGSASAFTAKIDLQTSGSGSGQVIVSATSTNYYPFAGYSGELCTGTADCRLGNLTSQSSKRVFVTFGEPICSNGIYSAYGACQLDGYQYSHLIEVIGPPGCVGTLPQVIKQSCSISTCGAAYTQNTGAVSGGEQSWYDSALKKLSDALSAIEKRLTGGGNTTQSPSEPASQAGSSQGKIWRDPQTGVEYYGSQAPGTFTGGGVDTGGKFDVIKDTGTIVKIGKVNQLAPVESAPSSSESLPKIPNIQLPQSKLNPIEVTVITVSEGLATNPDLKSNVASVQVPQAGGVKNSDILPPENTNPLPKAPDPVFDPTVPIAPPLNPCRQ